MKQAIEQETGKVPKKNDLVDLFIPAMNDTSSMHNNSSGGEEQDKDNFR